MPHQMEMDRLAAEGRYEIKKRDAEIDRLRVAIGWALGERPDVNGNWFGELQDDERTKPYWWRTHLRKIAGMETYVYDKERRAIGPEQGTKE